MTAAITLLTDFGERDGFVAAMKGIMATTAPRAPLHDAGHGIPPGDVRTAMFALGRYWRLYPRSTVHLVVVDPGVGTLRRALALEADGRFVVAPDNGLVTQVLLEASQWQAVALPPGAAGGGASRTFHGRDVFAPAAASLALGRALSDLGEPLPDPIRLRLAEPSRDEAGNVLGEVVTLDRFGNLITNVPGSWLPPGCPVRIEDRVVPSGLTYAVVEEGDAVAVVNSDGFLEIAIRGGSASERLGMGIGSRVRVLAGQDGV